MPYRAAPGHERRLAENFVARVASGHDPGPRGAQIRGLGLSLEASVRELRAARARAGLADGCAALIETRVLTARQARGYQAQDYVG